MTNPRYRGRFAPSPTGPLHFGSLVAALASFLEARNQGGQWLIRLEDLDPLREPPEATGQILSSLEAHGLLPDEPVRFQSRRHSAYQATIARLMEQGSAYRCPCSRKELQANEGRHPNQCRSGKAVTGDRPFAIRFALTDEDCHWQDLLLGPQQQIWMTRSYSARKDSTPISLRWWLMTLTRAFQMWSAARTCWK